MPTTLVVASVIGVTLFTVTTAVAKPMAGTPTATDQSAHYTRSACNQPAKRGHARCYATVWTPGTDHQIRPNADAPPAGALGPADIQSAYHLPNAGGGQTVAIVDAFGNSHAEADLATFRSHYGLPPCTSANGCLRIVNQQGNASPLPPDDAGWALETTLDLDAVSSACPNCNILLVQGDDNGDDSLGASVDTAVSLGAKYVSNSYGVAGEEPDQVNFDHYYSHPGVAVTVSAGDAGDVQSWPATNPDVIAVGGTRLTKATSTTRGWNESAWSDGGSGCSLYEPQPAYQDRIDTTCGDYRATADISADADPASGLAVFDTLGQSGWLQVGGTSLSSPLVASMYALAGQPSAGVLPVSYLYDPSKSGDFFDITTGKNGTCGNLLCTAGPGWDGPTGLGSPNGVDALVQGPHGDIAGQVTDAATGQPIAGAKVTTSAGYVTRSDAQGHYDLSVVPGSYDVSVSAFRYPAVTHSATATNGQTTTLDFALTSVPSASVSGAVTDGSGHGWPLYAEITIDGYPAGPIFTDPSTGAYSVQLPQGGDYILRVAPMYGGYLAQQTRVHVGTADLRQDFRTKVDETTCNAPGYGWNGLNTTFTRWTGDTAADGWSVSGGTASWRFDDPGNRPAPPGGDDRFAIADSAFYGSAGLGTALTSPAIDLSQQAHPVLSFDGSYYAATRGTVAEVALSTDGGHRWASVWKHTTTNAIGHVELQIPQAAGKSGVRVRFGFAGKGGWWWAVDNVSVGTHECVPTSGGLLIGTVTDKATGKGIDGATVTSAAGLDATGTASATQDNAIRDGFYYLFTPQAGSQQVTATATGYVSDMASVDVATDQVTRHDWALTAKGGN
ncbi:hypothetical protein Raf01_73280 [Rugosimonospora africana]|uniref:Peptidase S53 domain-containing protein n=2 Tax=Rugosimonospora africana TaxID=556532 RepID=A0A8J3QZ06_9ACTN|nr:hypothetical protein Raf01_73280 [Rugosimonospora africana]